MRRRGERGASAVEYALLIVGLALVLIVGLKGLQAVTEAGFRSAACDPENGMQLTDDPDTPEVECPDPTPTPSP